MILNIVLAYLSISSGAIASDKCSQSFELANFPQVRALVYYHALKLEEGIFYLNNGDYKFN